jgi:hypothetical protein
VGYSTAPQPLVGFLGFAERILAAGQARHLTQGLPAGIQGKGNVGIVVHSRTCLHCMMLHVTERRLERRKPTAFSTDTV